MDDAAAIEHCRGGERDAFRYLVERYQKEAIMHALAILRHREDALDAVQEAFLTAFRTLHRFNSTCPFYPWLYTILRNRCYKLLDLRRRQTAQAVDGLEVLARRSDSSSARNTELLEQAMARLSPQDRELIMLKHQDGLRYRDLAALLNIPAGTVMSRLHQARTRLRQKWLELSGERGTPQGEP
jgi:RNA polymerase sigma-70 factor (ECF subfamily)